MAFGWFFLRDNWPESLFRRDWLVFYLVLNKAVVGLDRINSVSKVFTGLRKTLFLARATLGILHQGMLPVLCVCSSNSAGVSILEWINKGKGWSCLECKVSCCDVNALDGCSEECPLNRTVWISPHTECPSYAELTLWNWFEKLLNSVFDRHHIFIFKLLKPF